MSRWHFLKELKLVKVTGVLTWEHEVKDGVIEYCFYNKAENKAIMIDSSGKEYPNEVK